MDQLERLAVSAINATIANLNSSIRLEAREIDIHREAIMEHQANIASLMKTKMRYEEELESRIVGTDAYRRKVERNGQLRIGEGHAE